MNFFSQKLLVIGAVLLLPACTTDTAAKYEETPYEKRTAGEGELAQDVDPVLQCQNDCKTWKSRALKAEAKAKRLQEKFRAHQQK